MSPSERHSRSRSARQAVVVTIDGPAGTGKSTVAHRLAERLGLEFLDTGAMYRAVALIALHQQIDPEDGERLAEAVRRAMLRFDWTTRPPHLTIDGRDVSDRIRDADVNAVVSIVAAQTAVREVLVERQRAIAHEHPRLVTEGRDQGSVVFPDAPVRFFLDADVEERARRRAGQLIRMGKPVDEAEVISGIRERDRIDSTRTDGPLVRPEGAIVIDTSHRSIDEVVDVLESETRAALPGAGFRT